MAVDLHLHSSYSDGSEAPGDIVAEAAALGLRTIALTDHDNLDGIEPAREAARAHGVELIAGTELSVNWRATTMHLLVYFLEPDDGPLQQALVEVRRGRAERNVAMTARLQELGIHIDHDEVAARAGDGVMGRPHFASVLVDKGHAESISDAFDRFLASGRPGYVPRRRLEADDAIGLAAASGAVTSVAHPHTLGVSAADYAAAFTDLARTGLGGIEAYYSEYTPEVRDHLARLASDLGLVATGGSDYHGAYKPGINIGDGRGDLIVPDSVVADLHAARERVRPA